MGITLSLGALLIALARSQQVSFVTNVEWSVSDTNQTKHGSPVESMRISWKSKYIWSSSAQNHVELKVDLSLNELVHGATRKLDLPVLQELCPLDICPLCSGTGVLHSKNSVGLSALVEHVSFPCPACAGSGNQLTKRPCIHLPHDSSIEASEFSFTTEELLIFIPPNAMKGQSFIYRPFDSPLVQHIADQNSSKVRKFKSRSDCGIITINISDIIFPTDLVITKNPFRGLNDLILQSTKLSAEIDHLLLVVPISAEEATFGFSRKLKLFGDERSPCKELEIRRIGKPTLPDSKLSLTLLDLYRQLCFLQPDDIVENSYGNSTSDFLSPILGDSMEMNAFRVALHIKFQVLNISSYQDAFMQYWNCSIVEIIDTVEDIKANEEIDVIDLDVSSNFGSPPISIPLTKPLIRREISCIDTEYMDERNVMFLAIQESKDKDVKYLNWLEFLSRS